MIRVHFQHFIRAVVLAVFAIFFIGLHITGDITKYINPKYDGMSKIAAGVFILFFCIQLFRIWEKEETPMLTVHRVVPMTMGIPVPCPKG